MAHDHHETPEPQAGDAVGPYDLIAPIGAGGMARVWAARVRGKPDIVAVKMLLPELAENVEFRKMFFDEARIASRVRHPNVCSTFEMGDEAGTLYLAMEWLDGPSLLRVLRPGCDDMTECARMPIRPRVAARVVADACAGLHAAHELVDDDGRPLAVVHRDVSPHNLLMTSSGEVKITDVGVAKAPPRRREPSVRRSFRCGRPARSSMVRQARTAPARRPEAAFVCASRRAARSSSWTASCFRVAPTRSPSRSMRRASMC